MVTKGRAIANILWSLGERVAASGVAFVISIILARMLNPEEFGVVAIILVFISIADTLVTNGFSVSLIQKKNADINDFSCMLVASFIISLGLYLVIWLLAPFIEYFYRYDGLAVMMRLLAIKVPISAVNGIQHAYVSKKMQFKKFFYATIVGTITSGAIGVILAYNGYGVWALIWQYLLNAIIDTIFIALTIRIKFKMFFSFKIFWPLWNYGWRIAFASFIRELYNQIRSLLIGKMYSSADLAFYNKGMHFPQLIINNVNSALGSVMFPILADADRDVGLIRSYSRKFIKMTSYIIWPSMVGLAIIARPLITILLTEKWLESVFYLRVGAIAYVFIPISTANLQSIKALGRADIIARIEMIKRALCIAILVISIRFGVKAIAIGWLVSLIICIYINMVPNSKLLDYSIKEQIRDISVPAFLSIIMGVGIWGISLLIHNDYILLLLQIIFGASIYLAASRFLKIDSYLIAVEYIKNTFRGSGKNE